MTICIYVVIYITDSIKRYSYIYCDIIKTTTWYNIWMYLGHAYVYRLISNVYRYAGRQNNTPGNRPIEFQPYWYIFNKQCLKILRNNRHFTNPKVYTYKISVIKVVYNICTNTLILNWTALPLLRIKEKCRLL